LQAPPAETFWAENAARGTREKIRIRATAL